MYVYSRHVAALPLLLAVMTMLSAPALAQHLAVGVATGADQVNLQTAINQTISTSSPFDVQVVSYTGPSASAQALAAQIVSGTAPDVLVVPYYVARELHMLGLLLPLNDLIQRDPGLSQRVAEVYAGVMETARVDGAIIGLPRSLQLDLIVYNQDHGSETGVEIQPNWTWDDFSVVAQRLSVYSAPTGEVAYLSSESGPVRTELRQEGALFCAQPECWLPFVWSNGGDFLDPGDRQSGLVSESARDALAWMRDHLARGWVAFSPVPTALPLARGMAALAPGTTALLTARGISFDHDGVPSLQGVPFPASPRTGRQVSVLHPDMYVIPRSTKNAQTAAEFLRLALTPAAQRHALDAGLYPVVRDVDYAPALNQLSPDVLGMAAAQGKLLPVTMIGETNVWSIVTPQVRAFFEGSIDLDTMVRNVDGAVARLYQEAGN